jgi:hypothetical protein
MQMRFFHTKELLIQIAKFYRQKSTAPPNITQVNFKNVQNLSPSFPIRLRATAWQHKLTDKNYIKLHNLRV